MIETPQGARFALGNVSDAARQRNVAFVSLWDAFPNVTRIEVGAGGLGAWVLLAGSTNPMKTRLANGELRLRYADGSADVMELVPPLNYWALSGWGRADYDYETDAFTLPAVPPPTVQLGAANRAMVYYWPLRKGATLEAVELEALSEEVVIGILAVSVVS